MAEVETKPTETATETASAAPSPPAEAAEDDIQSKIKSAMQSRVSHFKQQADSLTLEGVRRLLETDLGLPVFSLDVHKTFVKQSLNQFLSGAADEKASKDSEAKEWNHVQSTRGEAVESQNHIKELCSDADNKMEDSPIMGLLIDQEKKSTKSKNEGSPAKEKESKVLHNESSIKKAVLKRASYLRANAETISMAGVRRLLEEDLKLEKYALDPFKKLISGHVDQILAEKPEPQKKNLKKNSQTKVSKTVSRKENSDSLDEENDDEEDEAEAKPKKKAVLKQKQNSGGLKKRKRPEKESKTPGKKQKKPVENEHSDAEDDENASEDGNSQSSAEKPEKKKEKKEVTTPAYGKRVDNLKSVIKSCGMSVPPSVYKKIKQVPENKRETQLIKELEDILSREGLSPNPSEKEIKEVRKRKERAKELEGIDTSNIVLSSRRRSTTSYAPPPKPKLPESDKSSDEDGDEDEENEDDDSNEDNDGDDDGDDGSQSEESDEEQAEDSR